MARQGGRQGNVSLHDPFSSLSTMALTAPKPAAAAISAAVVQPMALIPPPPRASTAVSAPAHAPAAKSGVDLLW